MGDIEELIQNAGPVSPSMRRSITSSEAPDLLADPAEGVGADGSGQDEYVQTLVHNLAEKMQKKFDKLDHSITDKQKVIEAKLKKSIKEQGDKHSKSIKHLETTQNKV